MSDSAVPYFSVINHRGLVPKPAHFEIMDEGATLSLGTLVPEGEYAAEVLSALEVIPLFCIPERETTVNTSTDGSLPAEAYRLEITPDSVQVVAGDAAGAFYAVISLLQLALQYRAEIPLLKVIDQPRYSYRGQMVDVARSFLTVAQIRDIIDAGAAHKLNILHLHIIDDQGWRIEITNEGREDGDDTDYTALHRIGSTTACQSGEDPGFDKPEEALGVVVDYHNDFSGVAQGHTGYYTQAEFLELRDYARRRHIEIIPEVEFPGHNHVVMHALPQLATAGASVQAQVNEVGESTVPAWTSWQVGHSYLDFNNEATWAFARHLFRQMYRLVGDTPLHLGGDEAMHMIVKLGMEGYLKAMNRVLQIARETGFSQVILWEEGALMDLGPSDTVQFWTTQYGEELLEKLNQRVLETGCSLINSNAHHAYLDQKLSLDDPRGLTWACPEGLPTETSYNWNPDEDFPPAVQAHLQGVEAPLWGETVRGLDDAFYLMYPRLAAIAEVAWTPQADRDWEDFSARL
ncbi:family 20 glycosylhydrolase [Boudabousia marimammalium]|uniref:beta-N-acetylhexosaminidase n=1 Tax=Boudabousia marimammalium TaxID=156892 RepID=A0A1Q5PPJ7_9ACTO|nr:family 20 glycosylhydrolase [Boudabousia marimammalium]OKL49325.1 hypothetical protein BM477_04930 [Boudabousia marimammalium]